MSAPSIQTHARLLMWLVTIPFAALAVLAVLLVGNVVWQGGQHAGLVAIYYLPMILYIWAIWMIRTALKTIATGTLFDRALVRLMFHAGLALFCGALFTVFGIPAITALISGRPYLATFEPSPVTLGIVGITLMLFSQLFAQAIAMRDEIEGFF